MRLFDPSAAMEGSVPCFHLSFNNVASNCQRKIDVVFPANRATEDHIVSGSRLTQCGACQQQTK